MSDAKQTINIFEFDNYRDYLQALYHQLKQSGGFFSYRYFSQKAGLKSPNFLQLVIQGKRNLTSSSIEKCSLVFQHTKEEAVFFRNLVLLNQAQTIEEKTYHTEQILKVPAYKKSNPLSAKQFTYYSKWYLIPIREMVGSSYFKEDPNWIATHLKPSISAVDAKKALDTLLELNLIQRNPKGKLVQTSELVATGDDIKNSYVAQWHRQMIQKGAEAIDRFKAKEREISSVTIGVSPKSADKVKKLVRQFRKQLMDLAAQENDIQSIYQLNFQLFSLTKQLPEEKQS